MMVKKKKKLGRLEASCCCQMGWSRTTILRALRETLKKERKYPPSGEKKTLFMPGVKGQNRQNIAEMRSTKSEQNGVK